METHSSILAWTILCIEEPGSYSLWGHKESDTIEQLRFNTVREKERKKKALGSKKTERGKKSSGNLKTE